MPAGWRLKEINIDLDFSRLNRSKDLFRAGFPNYRNEQVGALDKKHQRILTGLEGSVDWLNGITKFNFREWSEQNDLGAPSDFSYVLHGNGSFLRRLKRYMYKKSVGCESDRSSLASASDDLSILDSKGAIEVLLRNPVADTPGVGEYCSYGTSSYNLRWLRYIYLARQFQNLGLGTSTKIWLDIGSYYGGLQGIIRKEFPDLPIILLDFHHQLFRSFYYLSAQFPNHAHNLGISETVKNISPGSFNYVHVEDFEKLSELGIDLVTNFFSFGEMKRETFTNYLRSGVILNSKKLYLVNRFISAPFFSPTYDTDLTISDYLQPNFQVTYLDIFPIHYWHRVKQELFGKSSFRSISSPYFELLLTKV